MVALARVSYHSLQVQMAVQVMDVFRILQVLRGGWERLVYRSRQELKDFFRSLLQDLHRRIDQDDFQEGIHCRNLVLVDLDLV